MSSNNTNISPHRDHNNQIKRVPNTVPWAWFIHIYLRSIAKQVIPTYYSLLTAHSRWNQFFNFNKVLEEREARPILKCWALSKKASVTIFITSLVWRNQGSNPWPPSRGECSNHWATAAVPWASHYLFEFLNKADMSDGVPLLYQHFL